MIEIPKNPSELIIFLPSIRIVLCLKRKGFTGFFVNKVFHLKCWYAESDVKLLK